MCSAVSSSLPVGTRFVTVRPAPFVYYFHFLLNAHCSYVKIITRIPPETLHKEEHVWKQEKRYRNSHLKTLVKFLKYVGAELEESTGDYDDEFVSRLQNSVKKIKKDREMGRRYMLFEELMRDEYRAGKEEGLAEGRAEGLAEGRNEGITQSILLLLSQKFNISQEIQNRITERTDVEALTALLAKVPQTDSEETLINTLDQLGF